jgi:hypothetical protein
MPSALWSGTISTFDGPAKRNVTRAHRRRADPRAANRCIESAHRSLARDAPGNRERFE